MTGDFLYIHSHKIEKKRNGEEERGEKKKKGDFLGCDAIKSSEEAAAEV
jgi:hypothetical protein